MQNYTKAVPQEIKELHQELIDCAGDQLSKDEILWQTSIINICTYQITQKHILIKTPAKVIIIKNKDSFALHRLFAISPLSHTK